LKEEIERKEGDVWEERGKKWTIKNGVKQNVTKGDKIKKLVHLPLTCPRCGGSLSTRLDEKMYRIHGFCFECTLSMEAHLREMGLYEEYEKKLMKGNIDGFLKGMSEWLQDLKIGESGFISENGEKEDWNSNETKVKEVITENLKKYKELLEERLNTF